MIAQNRLRAMAEYMQVTCIKNKLDSIHDGRVRSRLQMAIHLDGAITDLTIGDEYAVQALETRDGGLWLFLHTVAEHHYPEPYPAEMFEFQDRFVPLGWCMRFQLQQGNLALKRISFSEWAEDDHYYERLFDGDAEAIRSYERNRVRLLGASPR